MKVLNRILAVMLFLAIASPALAQGEWRFSITPSVWAAGLNGDIRIGEEVDLPFGEVADELRVNYNDAFGGTEIAGALAFEATNGRIGIIAEGFALDVSDGAEAPEIFSETAEVQVDHLILSVAGTYRVRPANPSIDLLFGARHYDVDVTMAILRDGAVDRSGSASEDWTDVIAGTRLLYDIGDKWWALGHFDVGGWGSEISYQLNLAGGYRFSRSASATLGYRIIGTDHQVKVFHYSSMKISGLYAGLKFAW